MNHFSKPARNPEYLIAQLIERGLIIEDRDHIAIINHIRTIGYYRLSGYFGPLQSEKDKFKDGTTFFDILRLYDFDSELRELSLIAIQRIEVLIRTLLTDVYSLGHNSFWYNDESLFTTETDSVSKMQCSIENGELVEREIQVDIQRYKLLMKEILNSVEKIEHQEFLMKFREDYAPDSPIPSWMVMECISFGKLSRIFSLLLPSEEKRFICKQVGAIVPDYLVSWLHAFVILRNICAHHARLWNKRIKDIKVPTRDKHRFLSNFSDVNTRKYYGVSSCMLRILEKIDIEYMIHFKKRFHELTSKYDIDVGAMGFPETYKEDDLWKTEGL